MEYLPRIVDEELRLLLEASGAVLIEGPKACGKTETASRTAASEVRFDRDEHAKQMVGLDVGTVLAGETPRLIDEWQLAPRVWNHVRHEVDRRRAPGQFILTGSAKPADDHTRHSGAGRFSRLTMRPFTLSESGQSSCRISLAKLLQSEAQSAARQELSISALGEILCVGGWPANIGKPLSAAIRANRGYIREICHVDVSRANGKSHDPTKVERLLRSLARNVATPVATSKLAADVAGANSQKLHAETAAEYLEALTRLMVVEDQPAWSPSLRSRTRLRAGAVRHFVDPSLAVAALGIAPDRLLADLKFFGFLFESLVIRDLRVYAQAADARVYHYREKDGLEVDAIVETADGRWAAFEIKLGERWLEEGKKNLLRVAKRLAGTDHGNPAALAVIVPSGYGYFRPGEVGIVPINALGQ